MYQLPTLEILERNLELTEDMIQKLNKKGLLKIENKVNPLLQDYNLYFLEVGKLIEQYLSQSDEIEKLLEYEGSLSEYKILKIIEKFSVASPKLMVKELPTISRSWISKLIKSLLDKGFIKKIEKGLYQLDKKGREIIK